MVYIVTEAVECSQNRFLTGLVAIFVIDVAVKYIWAGTCQNVLTLPLYFNTKASASILHVALHPLYY